MNPLSEYTPELCPPGAPAAAVMDRVFPTAVPTADDILAHREQLATPAAPLNRVFAFRFGMRAVGRYRVMVLDHGRVVQKRPWANNLILDQGLNFICSTYNWAEGFEYAVAGTGATPTYTDSGVITIDYNVTTVGRATASAPFFVPGMVGMMIQLNTGEQAYITAFVSNIDVTISNPAVVAAALGTVWAVNQTGMTTELKRSNTYLAGAGNCGTSDVGAARTMRRTYDFSVEVGPVNYAELGWSKSAAAANNLFARALVIGGTVTVLLGQQLRVVYDLTVTVSPSVSTAGTYVITNWPIAPSVNTDGNYILTGWKGNQQMASVSAAGVSTLTNALDPHTTTNSAMSLSTATVLPAFGANYVAANEATRDSTANGAYVAGTFTRTKTFHWLLASGVRADWRAVVVFWAAGGSANNAWAFVFAQNQTKDNAHTLDVAITTTIGRTLVNP